MPETLQKRSGKAIILHPPTMRVLILRLEAEERARRSTPGCEFDEWHIPGGSLEAEDDGSTEAAAIREAAEETGLDITVRRKIGNSEWNAFYDGQPAHFTADFYLAIAGEDEQKTPSIKLSRESSEAAWVSMKELTDYVGRGLTSQAVELIPVAVRTYEESLNG